MQIRNKGLDYQTYTPIYDPAMPGLSAVAVHVYLMLLYDPSEEGKKEWTVDQVQKKTGYGKRKVQLALRELEEKGRLERARGKVRKELKGCDWIIYPFDKALWQKHFPEEAIALKKMNLPWCFLNS